LTKQILLNIDKDMKKFSKDDKWLLTSCLQKSVRKGFAELARHYASELYELERSHLLYHLSIIALEDIGLGNLPVVHEFMQTQIRKTNIDEKGGKNYILSVVNNFALSVKDRSAHELTELANFHSNPLDADDEHLKTLFLNDEKPIVNRMIAGWEILGAQKLKNPMVMNKIDDLDKFVEINQKIVSSSQVIDIMKDAYLIHREPHFIALGLLSYLFEKEKGKKIGKYETGTFVEKKYQPELIDSTWLVDAIDWTTREGKLAIHEFCKEPVESVKYLKTHNVISDDRLEQAIGLLFARYSGNQVDKRLAYPSAVVILKLNEKTAFHKLLDNNKIDHQHAFSLFEKDYPVLKKKIEELFKLPNPKYFPF
jgi:hypothetical protein